MLTKNEIKVIRSLGDKSARLKTGLFVAEGTKLVGEIIGSDFTVREIYRVGENITAAEMERVSFLKTPSKVLALVEIPAKEMLIPTGGLSLVLDGIQDPGNLGTIIRLADWFGVEKVFCSPQTADCWSPKVVQATMGAILRVQVSYGPLEPFLRAVRSTGTRVFGTFLEGEPLYDCDLPGEGLIVMGNEGKGISREIEMLVTDKLFIPAFTAEGRAAASESLNVATAAAVTLSEFRRRSYRR